MFINSDSKLDKDTFRFVLPADLEKAADGSYKVKGLASTEKVDLQGETIVQKGIDLTPIDKKKGVLNWDHQKGPENTIGLLDGYQRTQKGLYIEGRLFKNHTKAKAVREIMESLGEGDRGRIGLSVEGRILERDPLNPSIIKKCQISAVAVTMNPVNTDTHADIVKSMNAEGGVEFDSQESSSIDDKSTEPTFTASQVMAIVQKALSVGSASAGAPNAKTGGDALQPSDMKAEKCTECGKENCSCIDKGGPGSGVKGHLTPASGRHADTERHFQSTTGDGGMGDRARARRLAREAQGSKPLSYEQTMNKLGKQAHKQRMKKMDKSLYKSNLVSILDKLQVLYPGCSRSELWEAVKDRLDTKFEIVKGGAGSGVKGHTTIRSKDYHWGTMRHAETQHQTVPIHPEHWEKMKNVHEGHKESDSFKDETGADWQVSRHPEGGVKLNHDSIRGKWEHHVGGEHFESAKPEDEAKKAIRIKNTSGKEREHQLYEQARQRGDYEENKDKSRVELDQAAKESGLPGKEKAQIRAQRDAAEQVGDRDHVRPNVKG